MVTENSRGTAGRESFHGVHLERSEDETHAMRGRNPHRSPKAHLSILRGVYSVEAFPCPPSLAGIPAVPLPPSPPAPFYIILRIPSQILRATTGLFMVYK